MLKVKICFREIVAAHYTLHPVDSSLVDSLLTELIINIPIVLLMPIIISGFRSYKTMIRHCPKE